MANDNDIIAKLKVEGLSQFKVEMSQSSKAVDSTTVSINKMEKAITEATNPKDIQRLTKELEAIKIASEAGATAFESSKAKLRAYKEEATGLAVVLATLKSEGKQNTQTFKDIEKQFESTKKKAGALSDQIGDINQEIKSLGSDTRGIDNVVRGATLMANGFQLATGVQALLGKENKALTEGLLKLNGIMAVTQSIQQIGNELTREDSIVKQAATKATALYNLVVGQSTGALKFFRLALAATGIGLVVVAIGLLIANWDKLKKAISNSTQSLEDFRKKQDEIRSANQKSFDDYETEIKYLVNIKQLTQEAADLKLSIKRKEAEESLKSVYDENTKKLQEYEQAVRNVTFAKDDGLTLSELETVRAQQKYIPTQKELAEQKRITKEAELDYKKAVNDRIQADEKGVIVSKKVKKATDDVKKGIEELKALNLEIGVTNGFDELDIRIKETQVLLESLYTGELASGGNPNENPQIVFLLAQLKKLKLELETARANFDALVNPSRATPNVPQIAGGGTKKTPSFWDTYFGSDKDANTKIQGAIKILQVIDQYSNEIANIASQATQQRTERELQTLKDKKDRGIISEKQYLKEEARIKNEAAQKQRNADIAMATAKIPLIVLQAYASAPPPFSFILAGIAGALALAQVAILSAAPLPKFRDGGHVGKKLGLIKGAKHEQGGVPIEVEGDEFVVKSQATKKYGVKMLDDINNLRFNPILSANKKLKTQSNDLRLYENLATISSYLKQGYKVDANGNQILKEISNKLNNKTIYV